MGRELRGIKGKDAIKAFIRAGGIERPMDKRIGLLLNFNVERLKDGIKRLII